jgi:hypothetical protein
MTAQTNSAGAKARRRIRYIDRTLQKRLLAAFIMLEVLLVIAGLVYLHGSLEAVLEENLYRIHLANSEPIFSLLLHKTALVLGGLLLANIVALGFANWLWTRYVESILRPFSDLLERTGRLDLSVDAGIQPRHQVLVLALAWREAERARCRRIREVLRNLSSDADHASPSARAEIRAGLERIKANLP